MDERVENKQNGDQKILVGIASYRDPELLKTILSAIKNAKHKDRLVFAIVNQFDDSTKHDFDHFSFPNLKLVQLDYRHSAGVGFARRLMTDLLDDEDFCLQIDSHMRFEPDWDEILLQEWQACEDDRAVLSVHPMGYTYEESGAEVLQPDTQVGKMRVEKFNKVIPIFYGERTKPKSDKPEPTLGLAGGLVFGSRESFMPYIREVCFMGEEFVRAFQLFSYGFNLYTPRRVPLRHLYKRTATRFWNDMPAIGEKDKYNKMTADSYKFVRQLLAGSLKDYDRHFGRTRSLQEYEEYLGLPILLETEHSTPEPENLKPGAEQDAKKVFDGIFRANTWGAKESVSGLGSSLKATDKIAREIERIVRDYQIASVLDLPCGDFNWMQTVDLGGAKYIGADIVEDLVKQNQAKYPNRDFRTLDLLKDDLPPADLIIVRDCLVHFPYDLIETALKNIKKSGTKYLLATNFPDHQNYDIALGAWRPINLLAEPLNVDFEVLETINEGCTEGSGRYADKSLVLFRL